MLSNPSPPSEGGARQKVAAASFCYTLAKGFFFLPLMRSRARVDGRKAERKEEEEEEEADLTSEKKKEKLSRKGKG